MENQFGKMLIIVEVCVMYLDVFILYSLLLFMCDNLPKQNKLKGKEWAAELKERQEEQMETASKEHHGVPRTSLELPAQRNSQITPPHPVLVAN